MKLIQSFIRLASTPPWANVTNWKDGTEGFWVDTNVGMPMFLRKSDHVIWIPRTLRGKKIEDLTPEEVKALPKEDNGKNLYKQWREFNDKEQAVSKLHNGYAFNDPGQVLVERLRKLVDKYELDDVANLGLDRKSLINPMLFDKLVTSNNRDDVKRIGRLIAKKFAMVIHLLNQTNPKVAKRLDADFMFQYKKLQALFDFDVMEFEPNLPEPLPPTEPTFLSHILSNAVQQVVSQVPPNKDPQVAAALQALQRMVVRSQDENMDQRVAILECQNDFHEAISALTQITRIAPPEHPLHQYALQVLNIPALKDLYNLLFGFEEQ